MTHVSLEKKGYMTSKDAGAILGYTHDYISRLCRHGKMSGIQKGREWFVTAEEIEAFKKRHEVELHEKKKELSKKFSRIRLEAEAKKRKARENTPSLTAGSVAIASATPSIKKNIKFVMPRELIAVCILALLILVPGIAGNFGSASSTPSQTSNSYSGSSLGQVTTNIEQGIQDTLYAQSTVVAPTASVFAFLPYLSDGYWQFFQTIGQLPAHTYNTWMNISNIYLAVYLIQGELVYDSFSNLSTVGASVLWGYELLGQSVVVGALNIADTFADILKTDSHAESLKKN